MSQLLPKLVKNQLLFREVNERLRDTVGSFEGPLEFLCECSADDCIDTLELTLDEYERIRAHPNLFVISTGHEQLDVDRVVDQARDHLLVEKTVGAAAVIEADPRSRET